MSTNYYINKDLYVDDTGKQLKDIKTNADNIATNTTNITNNTNKIATLSYNLTTGSSPIKTGRRVEGKDEYVVKVNCGNMPNNTTKNITLPISLANVTITRKVELFGQSSQNEFPIMQTGISWFISGGGNILSITTTSDRTRFTCFTEIYFTYKR